MFIMISGNTILPPDTWTQKANFGGTARLRATGLSINGKGYIGTGYAYYSNTYKNDFWEYTPDTSSCPVPTNLSVTNITSSSAKLNWDAVAGAEGYTVRYKVAGINGWTYRTANGTSKILGGLSPNTAYKWEVRTFCQIARPSGNVCLVFKAGIYYWIIANG